MLTLYKPPLMDELFPIRFGRLRVLEDNVMGMPESFALTFLIVMVIVLGVWMVASGDNKQEVVRRRMEAVRKAERRGEVSLGLKLARDEMLSSVPAVHRLMQHWQWSVRLQERIAQAGLKNESGQAHPHERLLRVWEPFLLTRPFHTLSFGWESFSASQSPSCPTASCLTSGKSACSSLKSGSRKRWT